MKNKKDAKQKLNENVSQIKKLTGLSTPKIANILGMEYRGLHTILSDNSTRQPTKIHLAASELLLIIAENNLLE